MQINQNRRCILGFLQKPRFSDNCLPFLVLRDLEGGFQAKEIVLDRTHEDLGTFMKRAKSGTLDHVGPAVKDNKPM